MREEKKKSISSEDEDENRKKLCTGDDEKTQMKDTKQDHDEMRQIESEQKAKSKLNKYGQDDNDRLPHNEVMGNDKEMNHDENSNCKALGDAEQTKHVTYNDMVEIIQVNKEKQVAFSEQVEAIGQDSKISFHEATISDPNFRRKVTFSNEIIVIAYNHDENRTHEGAMIESDTREMRSKLKTGMVFGHPLDMKHDEITVNYADRVVSSRNIFKTVSFSNEVTVIHDGNLVFTSDSSERTRDKNKMLNKSSPTRVDKLLTKLKKVVQKLEDKNQQSDNRDQKVLGDAEQYKTCNRQVQVVKVNQKQVAFSDHVESIENRSIELREPNLRKVTFSKEIIVIAYPYKNEDDMSFEYDDNINDGYKNMIGDRDLLDKTKYEEIEESSVNYAERSVSNRNIFKTVSFSNEVTVIHDGNLVFRSDSLESVKDSFDTKEATAELECKEIQT